MSALEFKEGIGYFSFPHSVRQHVLAFALIKYKEALWVYTIHRWMLNH